MNYKETKNDGLTFEESNVEAKTNANFSISLKQYFFSLKEFYSDVL